jgi:type I restriction enzyme S subunit
VLRANNIDLGGKLNLEDLKCIGKEMDPEKKLSKGDIFICMASGSKQHLGKVAYIDRDTEYYFGGFMGCVRSLKNIKSKFLFYLLNSPNFNKYLKEQISGVNINNLNQKTFYNFQIPLPSLSEQEKVLKELDSFNEEIGVKNEEIVDLEEKINTKIANLFE